MKNVEYCLSFVKVCQKATRIIIFLQLKHNNVETAPHP